MPSSDEMEPVPVPRRDRRYAQPGPVVADDLGEVGQAVVDAHDVARSDPGKPHWVIHAGVRSAHASARRHIGGVLCIEDQLERAGLESALVAGVAQEPAFG